MKNIVFSYSIVMIWTQSVGVIVLVFPWKFWLAIISGENFAVFALVGNYQLVEDANRRPWLMIWSHQKRVILSDMILGFPSIVGNAGCLAHCAGSLPKYDKLTIELINLYYKWAIKLFGNYKKSMMIRKVCQMCYKFDGKFMIKYFIVYLKIRLLHYV